MRNTPIERPRERNPVTRAAHRHQVFWQITVPFVIGIVLILTLATLTFISALGGGDAVSMWADISLIWLIVPTILISLIFLIIVAGLAYGVVKAIGALPQVAYQIQNMLVILSVRLRAVMDAITKPVIQIKGFWAAVHTLFRR